ncbi:MAG: hypothetical protein ACYSWZ_25195 [Planctomycetota bacterium]|jgi:hypothetical protein
MSLKVKKWLKRLLKISVLITAVLVLTFVIIWFLFPFPEERLEQWSVSRTWAAHAQYCGQ